MQDRIYDIFIVLALIIGFIFGSFSSAESIFNSCVNTGEAQLLPGGSVTCSPKRNVDLELTSLPTVK